MHILLLHVIAGPCGGNQNFGSNGVNEVVNGQTVSLKIAYNGGHQSAANAFHVAMMCSDVNNKPGADAAMKVSGGDITTNPYTLTTVATIPAADSSSVGYTFNFALPLQTLATKSYCVVSLLDQRNWGGCIDFHLNAPGSGTTTSGPVQSPCDKYCTTMAANCASVYANTAACKTACANFPTNGATSNKCIYTIITMYQFYIYSWFWSISAY